MPFEKQVVIIFAANNGYVDDYPVGALKRYEAELMSYLENRAAEALSELREKKQIDDSVKAKLVAALDQFKKEFTA
jgi:F-type H+-transporting ATPase subunit alpha